MSSRPLLPHSSTDRSRNRFDAASLAFHQQVRQGYLALAGAEPGRWRVIDAARAADVVAVDVWRAVGEVLAVI